MKIPVNFKLLRYRYQKSDRQGKTKLLNELCDLHRYNQKYLVQIFNFHAKKKYLRRGRRRRYASKELVEALTTIWLATDQMCGKRLKAAMTFWLPWYESPSTEVEQQLLTLSPATIDRLLKPYRA